MATIEERLNSIHIKDEQMAMIQKEARLKQLTSGGGAIASVLTGGISDIFTPLMEVNADIERGIRETKQALLLEMFLNRVDDMTVGFDKLKAMIGDSYGNHIFNRLLRLLEDFPPEEAYIAMMSSILEKFVASENFKELFGIHQLHLRLIERFSPQALYLLSHYDELLPFTKDVHTKVWNVELGVHELQGDWSLDVVKANSLDERLAPVIAELIDGHCLIAVAQSEENNFKVALAPSGKFLLDYLK